MQQIVSQYKLQSRLILDAETPLEYLNLQRIRMNLLHSGYAMYGQAFLNAIS